MALKKKDLEHLKGASVKEMIAYGASMGQGWELSKKIADVVTSGFKKLKEWVKGGKKRKV